MIILTLIVLAIMVFGAIAGFNLLTRAIKEMTRQVKAEKKANKEIKVKQKKEKVKMTKVEKTKIKHEANKKSYEDKVKTVALRRFEDGFGYAFGKKDATESVFQQALRFNELKKEVKLERKANKKNK